MAYLPSTPTVGTSNTGLPHHQGFGPTTQGHQSITITPTSTTSSNNTFLMPTSPQKGRHASGDGYRPKIARTIGQRPACLVNASVTYCEDDQIYAFGGFDQYTDEVYNHVLKLDLGSLQWSLVDNYGDIPGVRMGHTATLYQGDKLLIYGGENEHRMYLSDVVIFDLKTAHWTQPNVSGAIPKGRARHAAVIHEDKLFIVGGITGHTDTVVLDDICYLDLKTWTWSRTWKFVGRFDHAAWIWGGRLWLIGGLGQDMERGGEIMWLDLKGNPAFDTVLVSGPSDRKNLTGRHGQNGRSRYSNQPQVLATGLSGYAANSSSVQISSSASHGIVSPPVAPGSISSLKFVSGPNLPSQASGSHFHMYSSGMLLDFVTPASTIRPSDCNLSALGLDTLRWQTLAEGADIFNPGYRWHYCAMNQEGTKAWLLGCATDPPANGGGENFEEYLSDVLPIDLRKFGLLGNSLAPEPLPENGKMPASDRHASSSLTGLGADLAGMFDQPPETGSGTDFTITGEPNEQILSEEEDDVSIHSSSRDPADQENWLSPNANTSVSIYVHKLILQARWPHFGRLYAAQMAEFHTKRMHIPEPYPVVRAFLYYLYTDSIARHPQYCADLGDVAGMLVMANIYDMPRLRLLCVNQLSRELGVEYAAVVWERAGTAGEEWLRKRAAGFCLTHWGRVVRTPAFRKLSRQSLMELCEEVDTEGRVVGGEELEVIGGLGGTKFGAGGSERDVGKGRSSSAGIQLGEEMEDGEAEDDEGMEMN
ncbi:MAG: hypothetical protein M1827_001207 [Pycnora praestabilis]|nr:MAG: hypothetical protein M1827_001207 [Pycnora praestabilis]